MTYKREIVQIFCKNTHTRKNIIIDFIIDLYMYKENNV